MTNLQIIEGTNCIQNHPEGALGPDRFASMIALQKERLPIEYIRAIPLSRDFQTMLYEHSHYLGIKAREALLIRLAASTDFHAPLFYELCDRAGRGVLRRAWNIAKAAKKTNRLYMLEEAMGECPEEEATGFRALLDRALGLAF